MVMGIVGSRRRRSRNDKELLRRELLRYRPAMIVSGGCSEGADRFAEELAAELHIPLMVYRPRTSGVRSYSEAVRRYYDRNERIARASDMLVALVSSDRRGGTENTIRHFKRIRAHCPLVVL